MNSIKLSDKELEGIVGGAGVVLPNGVSLSKDVGNMQDAILNSAIQITTKNPAFGEHFPITYVP